MKKKILFVCTGNTCRSPLMEIFTLEFLAGLCDDRWDVQSAGLAVADGTPASNRARKVAQEYGLDLSGHLSRPLTPQDVSAVDLVLVMTESHRQFLLANMPQFSQKIYTLKKYLDLEGDVSDPFGGNLEDYRATALELRGLAENLTQKLREVE